MWQVVDYSKLSLGNRPKQAGFTESEVNCPTVSRQAGRPVTRIACLFDIPKIVCRASCMQNQYL